MKKEEIIKWLQNLKKDIGQSQHQDLWHYAEMLDKVIGSLEGSEDAISRTGFIEMIKGMITDATSHGISPRLDPHFVISMVKSAPSVIPEPKEGEWIPCDERLPEKDGSYLVCMSFNYHSMDVLMWADGWNCIRRINGEIDRKSEIDGTAIIAWMPLPEPWKGADDDN